MPAALVGAEIWMSAVMPSVPVIDSVFCGANTMDVAIGAARPIIAESDSPCVIVRFSVSGAPQ